MGRGGETAVAEREVVFIFADISKSRTACGTGVFADSVSNCRTVTFRSVVKRTTVGVNGGLKTSLCARDGEHSLHDDIHGIVTHAHGAVCENREARVCARSASNSHPLGEGEEQKR